MFKNKLLLLLLLFIGVLVLDSCTTLKNVSTSIKTSFHKGLAFQQNDAYAQSSINDTNSIDFLENIF